MDTELLLTPSEAANRLRLAKQTLARWRCEGCGPRFIRLSGNRVAYRMGDLDDWIARRSLASTSERIGG